ncbi:hypothetical protein M0R45_031933 [Rubus argutus]|uniref:non-specific serine/threonine protein kinase n=1 Tax=Rubus argutus TaxID=59490 RepID=A0AAW1WJ38_RUBAR
MAYLYGPVVPPYLSTTTVYTPSALLPAENYSFSILKTENSTLPLIINAIEIYKLKDFSLLEADENDVAAIMNIKSTYVVEKNWEGDPCAPQEFIWEGLSCSSNGFDPPRIISLNLSSSGLTGEITSYISNLVTLQSLDLSNNNLTGSVPEFLSELQNLKVLNLEKNKLNGSVPAKLAERSRSGSLALSVGENGNLCSAISCEKKKSNVLIPLIASVGGVFILLLAAVATFMGLKRRRKPQVVTTGAGSTNLNDSFESKKRQFTYSEVLEITNNFQRILGKGGFGTVYHGYVDSTQVAVKLLSPSSAQGYKEFQTEVKLLMRVHHRNLTSLVGYCNEGTNMALIYDYMANGNLESHLLGDDSNPNILSWEGRMKIAMDAAQGLEYLHNGCRPPIVHRDVKTTNTLLAENFQAKLADFGLSRAFPTDEGTHMSTAVVGTPGYLDPGYHITGRLNEKSDVFSLGVALLQIITSRPVISRAAQASTHVSQWVSSMLGIGDVKSIVDPRLRGDFEVNSAWKAAELAMDCISEASTRRPNMSEVVMRLKECLAAELARKNESHVTGSTDAVLYSMNVTTKLNPSAR